MTDTTKPTPGYTAASNGRRLLSFRPPNMGPNSVTQYGLATIVGRSRSGVRNDPWVGTAGDKLVSNMVGTGIQSKMVNGTPELKAADKALWKRFMKECDADGVLDGYGQQALAVREWDEAGEVFGRKRRRRPEDGLAVPLQIQVIEAEQWERFCGKKYVGTKRFGLDGGESMIPALEAVIKYGGQLGVREIVYGMPHRGRLNVLANVLAKPYRVIFHEFSGGSANPDDVGGSGDVKYHLGTSTDREFDGIKVHMSLVPNPSHLEAVDPVVLGKARAKQFFDQCKLRLFFFTN